MRLLSINLILLIIYIVAPNITAELQVLGNNGTTIATFSVSNLFRHYSSDNTSSFKAIVVEANFSETCKVDIRWPETKTIRHINEILVLVDWAYAKRSAMCNLMPAVVL